MSSILGHSVRKGVYHVLCLLTTLALTPSCFAFPTFNEVRTSWHTSDVQLLDRHGIPLQRIRINKQVRKLDWVRLEDISPALRYALVLSEDQRFYMHSGVDWASVAAAAWGNIWNTRTRGASTLTMQLTGLLDNELKGGKNGRSLWQKLGQSWKANQLEQHWSKSQILEAYLNLVSFRGELVGLSAMSMVLFDKYPAGLNTEEAAIAVALLRAPNASPDKVATRACNLVQRIHTAHHSCQRIYLLTQQVLAKKSVPDVLFPQLAPHFARKWLTQKERRPGTRWISTLDANVQRYALSILRRHLTALAKRNVQDGAIIVLDNATGDILAWVGSSGSLSAAAEVDGVTAPRQAGSTLKPFLYQLALEGHWLTAASLLDDSPLNLQTETGLYMPQNYGHDFKGLVSVRTALASSLNIPAVRTIRFVSPNALRNRLYDLGLTTLTQEGDFYGFSLALGAADVRLIDLANAYRTLANQGQFSLPRGLLSAPRPLTQKKLNAASSFIITDILADRTARALTFGLDSALATRFWSAVKTGTSKDMRDNWTVGFSQHHTVAVWVGNASGAPMWDISGMHGAAPIWQTIMDYLHSLPSSPPKPPAGVTYRNIHYAGNIEPERQEWFLNGTERTMIIAADNTADHDPARIITPVDRSIYALDPDIPVRHQCIVFRSHSAPQAQWWLDNRKIGTGPMLAWLPWPGYHSLELKDPAGSVIDHLTFHVRGARVKPSGATPKRSTPCAHSPTP